VNVEKYFLDEIVGLGFVPENPLTNISDRKSVTAKECSERITIAYLNPSKKGCVVKSSRALGRNRSRLIAIQS